MLLLITISVMVSVTVSFSILEAPPYFSSIIGEEEPSLNIEDPTTLEVTLLASGFDSPGDLVSASSIFPLDVGETDQEPNKIILPPALRHVGPHGIPVIPHAANVERSDLLQYSSPVLSSVVASVVGPPIIFHRSEDAVIDYDDYITIPINLYGDED